MLILKKQIPMIAIMYRFKTLSLLILVLLLTKDVLSQDCNQIANDYLAFSSKAIAYYKRINKNPLSTNIYEYNEWDKKCRDWQDKVMSCAMKDMDAALKVYEPMTRLAEAIGKSQSISRSIPSKSSNSGASVSGSSTCSYCKPGNANGWYIQNFNASNRTYSNGRYVKKPGYKVCDVCQGTGDCRIKCSGGKRDCPGICDEMGTCTRCNGERFVMCNNCKGSGAK